MKTINLTDDQFNTLFEFVNQKVESIVDASVDSSIAFHSVSVKKFLTISNSSSL